MKPIKGIGWMAAVCSGVALAAGGAPAQAQQKYPSKPVRIVVGFSPGSATDISARMIGPKLAERWGQPVVVENRSGAGGTLAAAAVAKATSDGHTLLMISTSFAITAVLQPKLPYDVLRDFTGVTQIGTTTGMLAVPPSLGVEFVATSVTSLGDGFDINERFRTLLTQDPHMKFFNGQRGYVRHVVTPERWQADYRVLDRVSVPDGKLATRRSFVVENGRPGLVDA